MWDILSCHPKVEVSGTKGDRWIRLIGKLIPDHRLEAKEAVLAAVPSLNTIYNVNDGIFEVLYFTDAKAAIYSFTNAPEEIVL